MKYLSLFFYLISLFLLVPIVHSDVLIIDAGVIFDPDNSDTNFTFANQYNVTSLNINETHIEINGHMLKAEPATGEANCTIYEFNTSTTAKYRSFNMTATNTSDKIDYVVGGYNANSVLDLFVNNMRYSSLVQANSTGFIDFTHTGYISPQNFTFYLDDNSPLIDFVGPTYSDNKNTTDFAYVNVSVSDAASPDNLTALIDWNNSLVGWWRFNENSGTVAEDHSTYANNGTLHNMNNDDWVDGKFGNALDFDGVDANIGSINKFSELSANGASFSYGGWAKKNNYISGQRMFGRGYNWDVYNTLTDKVCATFRNVSNNNLEVCADNVMYDNWIHIFIVKDDYDFYIYINGVLEDNTSNINWRQLRDAYEDGFCIGGMGTNCENNNFNGSIDEVRIYNRALSPEEINASYNAGLYRLYHNFTNLADGDYTYTAYVQDLAGNVNETEQRTVTIYTETYSDELFSDNIYADEYETANVTLTFNSGFTGTNQSYYTIPFDLNLVNSSSITIKNSSDGNITFTKVNNVLNFTVDGTQDPYYITYDVKAVKKMTVAEYGTCPLYYTSQTTYCSREVVVTPGSLSTYYYRYFINVTRNETNSSHILHNQSTGIFTSFATRDNLTVRVDDSSVNTTATVIGSTLQYNITNEHQSGSLYSLNEGTYYIDVWYNVVTGTPAGGTGGGGGGGGTVGDGVNTTGECIIDSDCYNIYGYSRRYCVNTSCSETHGFDCWADKDCIYKYGINKPYCVKNNCKSASEIECWYNSDCIAKYGDYKAYCINYECTSSKDALSFDVYPREINVETIVGDTERYQIRVVNYASEPFAFTLDVEGNHADWISIPNHQTMWNIDPLKSVTFSVDVSLQEPVYNEMSILRVKAKRDLSTDVKEIPINFNAIEGKDLGVFCDSDVECTSKSCIDSMCASYQTYPDSEEYPKQNTVWMYVVGAVILGGLILFLAWILTPKPTKE